MGVEDDSTASRHSACSHHFSVVQDASVRNRWRAATSSKSRGDVSCKRIGRQQRSHVNDFLEPELRLHSAGSLKSSRSGSASRFSRLEFRELYEAFLDLDGEEEQETENGTVFDADAACRRLYRRACRGLGVTPSVHFSRSLSGARVDMRGRMLGAKGTKALTMAMLENNKVTHLDLSTNDMGDRGAHYVAALLQENFFITSLVLSNNNITGESLHSLCGVLHDNPNLQNLDISGNLFQERDAKVLANLIDGNITLKELYLHHNTFREQGGIQLAKAIANNTSLHVLDLSWNHLRLKGGVAIAEAMAENDSIHTLNLAWNGLHIDGSKAMGKALETNTTLTDLDLTCNRINIDALYGLITGLKQNKVLEKLRLDKNSIGTDGAKLLLTCIENNASSAIQMIDISSQSVDSQFMDQLNMLMSKRPLKVSHGISLSQHSKQGEDDNLLHEDPMMVLMECMRQKNMRLVDWFQALDADGSKSLTRDEFRMGLKSANIPMSSRSLSKLLNKLDRDGDGEVDFSELMEGQKEYKRKLAKMHKKQQEAQDGPETELERVARKISKLLKAKMAMATAAAKARTQANHAQE